jgi:hypothetical protein
MFDQDQEHGFGGVTLACVAQLYRQAGLEVQGIADFLRRVNRTVVDLGGRGVSVVESKFSNAIQYRLQKVRIVGTFNRAFSPNHSFSPPGSIFAGACTAPTPA